MLGAGGSRGALPRACGAGVILARFGHVDLEHRGGGEVGVGDLDRIIVYR